MNRWIARFCCLTVALQAACGVARAEESGTVTPRFAVHAKFDRLVIALPAGAAFTTQQSGSTLVLHLSGVGRVSGLAVLGHRLVAAAGGAGELTLQLAQATHAHIYRMTDRLVVDVASTSVPDKAPSPTASSAPHVLALPGRKIAAGASGAGKMPVVKPAPTVAVAAAPLMSAPAAPVEAAPLSPSSASSGLAEAAPPTASLVPAPVTAPAVTMLGQDAALGGPAMLVPFGADVGAAAFRRGGEAHIVFDSPHALDLGQLKDDPAFGSVTERVLPDGIDLRMKLAADAQLRLARRSGGWAAALVHGLPALTSVGSKAADGVVMLSAASPGRVVVLDDDSTGTKLLVGTQRVDGQSMPAAHRSAEFAMAPTWLGVVVEPVSDRLSLQAVQTGFVLKAADGPKLAALWADAPTGASTDGSAMTRCFDLQNLPPDALHNQLTQALRDAALAPKLARFTARVSVAQAMLAQGLDREAQAVLHAATSDDPAHAQDPAATGLSMVGAWLWSQAGGSQMKLPDGFDPAILGGSDEARFWQALFQAGQPDVSQQAAALASTWPLLSQYAPILRRRILPEVGETLGRGRQDKALSAFLSAFPDPSLDLVRASLLNRQGKTDQALALLDEIARRPDRLARAEALRDAVEIRLAAHKMDAEHAAAALGRQLYAWRGDGRDLDLRFRVAGLRAQAGQWRQALALLRETDELFPEAHAQNHDLQARMVAELLRGDRAAKLSALDLVALADEAAPLLSAADADATLAPLMVDKLLALDLPARAQPILQGLFDHEDRLVPKAELGVRLAGLLADKGDTKGAMAALDASDDSGLDPELVARRGLLRARLLVADGKSADALGILGGLQGEAAVLSQAKILEGRHDWAGAAKLLEPLSANDAFAAKADQAKRDLILRLANDESEAGDMPALRRLRSAQGALFAAGPGAALFAVLTQEPVQAVGDLPRAGHELDAVRALPASLAAR